MESPLVFVIFGATGDLTARKLMPALFRLYKEHQVSQRLFIIGVGRRDLSDDAFRSLLRDAVKAHVGSAFSEAVWKELSSTIEYEQGLFESDGLYSRLVERLAAIDAKMRACVPRFFYLATPPQHYETILKFLQSSTLAEGCGHGSANFTRVIIEKPFGRDLITAQNLDALLAKIFDEKQIYRIDHYLGKETVQNILTFRFANGIFEPTWNAQFIDHVQVTIAEESGIGTRGAFYDGVGAIRDILQSHMLEMVALIAMEQPRVMDAQSIRDERVRVMKAIKCIAPHDAASVVVRGQYEGYRDEKNVEPKSTTETYVALKLMIDTKRWRGVPFYLRTGKKLEQKVTEISLHYKTPPCTEDACLFKPDSVMRNVLAIRIQPDEGINLRLMVKEPGLGMKPVPTEMEFCYSDAFGEIVADGYERLLLDTIRGDQTLFSRTDGISASWQFVTPILEGWEKTNAPLHIYTSGVMGPKAADELIEKDGRHWFLHGK